MCAQERAQQPKRTRISTPDLDKWLEGIMRADGDEKSGTVPHLQTIQSKWEARDLDALHHKTTESKRKGTHFGDI